VERWGFVGLRSKHIARVPLVCLAVHSYVQFLFSLFANGPGFISTDDGFPPACDLWTHSLKLGFLVNDIADAEI
jgi:hypothetical protein